MSANIKFLSDFIFLNFQRTHDRIDIYRFPNRKWYFLRFQINLFETLKNMKSDKKTVICWHCLFWFDLPFRKEERKFKQGSIMSTKVCQRFLYSIPTLGPKNGFFVQFISGLAKSSRLMFFGVGLPRSFWFRWLQNFKGYWI